MSPSNQALQQQKIHCDASLWEKIANPSYSKNRNKYIVMLLGYWAMPATVRKASVLVEAQNGVFFSIFNIGVTTQRNMKNRNRRITAQKMEQADSELRGPGCTPLSPSPPLLCWHQRPAPTLSLQQERGFSIWAIYSHLSFDHHQILGSWKL